MSRAGKGAQRWVTELRAARSPTWWREHTRWTLDRPWLVVIVLGAIGIAIRHAWLSTEPLSVGDWHWPDPQRLTANFPWPSIWDPTLGLGGENRFLDAFRYPVYAISASFTQLGVTWTFLEKALYFVPFAVLLPVSGWLLAREIMGRTRWALLTPVLLLGNTYFMLESNGEVPLAIAEVISFLALIAFLRTMRRHSIGWALVTGLLVAAVASYDVRPAYLCVVLMAMYFVILAVLERDWTAIGRRFLLGGVTGAVFLGAEAYWVLPLLTYQGNPGFPTPQAPNFNILTLGHGLTGVSAFWTGGQTAQLVQAPLNPAYMILPLLALTPMLARRLRPEVVWLCVAALCFAFFAKTDTPPLGSLYDWMYVHVPGWKLFREGSKFLYVVGIAYAILIPIALSSAFEWASSVRWPFRQLALRTGAALSLASVVALSCWSVVVLEGGSLGATTRSTPEPASFAAFSSIIANDKRPGPVLWFGQPLITSGIHNHTFLIGSSTHPAVNLTGNFAATKINQRDPFQLYCVNNLVPYCYANQQLFPYLTKMTATGYVVVPGGSAGGQLPKGITRSWLRGQMTAMFGQPQVLGSGDTTLLVWRMASPDPVVTTSPAVALVDSGTWAAGSVLPALQAMDVPAAYRETYEVAHYPTAPANLPDSVRVIPRLDGGCVGTVPGSVVVMAQSTAASLDLSVAGSAQTLPLLQAAARLPGWGMYGPINVAAGNVAMQSAGGSGVTLGPCIAWSALTERVLGAHSSAVTSVNVTSEKITATSAGNAGPWAELRRYYDLGWRLDTLKVQSLGDGLFGLYHLDAAHSASNHLTFSFSTTLYERIGDAVSVLVVVAALIFALRELRRVRLVAVDVRKFPPDHFVPGRMARWIAAAGMAMLAVTALAVTGEWFGVPSAAPGTSFASDPYGLDIGYGGVAVLILLLALVALVVSQMLGARRRLGKEKGVPVSARMGAAAVLVLSSLVLSACAGAPGDIQNIISEAQQAGAVAPSIQGASLDDARLQRAARQPDLCIADYTQVLNVYPDLVLAYAGRGDCYLNGGKNGLAAYHDYSQALTLSPDQSDLFLRRAVADRVIGNAAAAVADYKQAAAVPSATANQQLTAIDGLVAIREYDNARTVYRQALLRNPTASVLHVAGGDLAIATGNDLLADQEYATASQLVTNKHELAQVLSHECHVEVLRQQYVKARTDCANAASLSDVSSGALDDLSAAELGLGNLKAALSALDASIGSFVANIGPYAQPSGVDGFGLSHLYDARGWLDIQLHRTHDALADFQRAIQTLPNDAPDIRARIKGDIASAKAD